MGALCCSDTRPSQGTVIFERQIAERPLGKYTWRAIWGYKNACYEALRRAENEYGRPVYVHEIARSWRAVTIIPMVTAAFLRAGLQDLFKADEVLGDKELNRFTLNQENQSTALAPTEFELYSDRMQRLYPHFVLDEKLRLRPGPTAKRINFEELRSLLLSTDLSRCEELSHIKD